MIDHNDYFLLASAQLFPLPFLESRDIPYKSDALTVAREAFTVYREGQPEVALKLYSEAIRQFPDYPFFYACRSLLNMETGDGEGAFYDYQVAKGLDFHYHDFLEWVENRPEGVAALGMPNDLEELLAEALETTQQFDYEHTLRLYASAQETYPEDADILVYRGALHMRLLRYDQALLDLDQAIAIDPRHYQAYLFRAKLFRAVKEQEKAKADFDRSAAVQPDAAVIYEERGSFLVDLNRYDEGLLDFNKLIDLLPEDFYVYTLRADLFEKMEDWASALADYSKAIALNPYYSDLYAYRADMKDRLGDAAGAQEDRRMFDELEQED